MKRKQKSFMVLLTEICIKHSLNENALKIKKKNIGELYKAFIWYVYILLYPYSEFYIISSSGILFLCILCILLVFRSGSTVISPQCSLISPLQFHSRFSISCTSLEVNMKWKHQRSETLPNSRQVHTILHRSHTLVWVIHAVKHPMLLH